MPREGEKTPQKCHCLPCLVIGQTRSNIHTSHIHAHARTQRIGPIYVYIFFLFAARCAVDHLRAREQTSRVHATEAFLEFLNQRRGSDDSPFSTFHLKASRQQTTSRPLSQTWQRLFKSSLIVVGGGEKQEERGVEIVRVDQPLITEATLGKKKCSKTVSR